MWKRLLLRLTLRLLDRSFVVDYKSIDEKKISDWAFMSFDHTGWRSYFAREDLKIMKEMTFGKERDQYMVLVGRRLQLLYMFDTMKRVVELRKSEAEKKRSLAEKKRSLAEKKRSLAEKDKGK